ncbi:prolipoprotein diacylglyceryl transferase [Patescibacteria group bacterium]|nr:prolipoprotein diacylglyceryl transferase [Patescibacteria group bacterium]MBU1703290.1 prolipoprotein diacylglyceryl transferase [Patescibacteria group bacterium]MBU1954019.1 prolipoprotein diacylglyceryl transferase [Patescibacteria group bacterium]
MYPILLEFGPITIYSLWIFVAIGFFAALLITNKLVQKNRVPLRFISNYSLAIFFGGLIMSRIVYIIRNYELFFQDISFVSFLKFFHIWDKGLSPWGGVLGIILGLIFFARKEGESVRKWLDIFSVSILGAITFINIGAFLDGRNYGRETGLPWGIIAENSIYAVPIHPVQIYAAIYSGILTIVLYQLFNHKISKHPGNITLMAIGGYSFFKILEEFMRGDESNTLFGIREAQIYALLALLITIILFLVRKYKKTNT